MRYQIFADAGGTSVKWLVTDLETERRYEFSTPGISPIYMDEEHLLQSIESALPSVSFRTNVTFIEFYGSGCGTDQAPDRIRNILQKLFPAAELRIDSDMVGAAHALWGNASGTVAIIGTGSNAGYYDGETVHYARPSLGYFLGDEGSAVWLVRHLLHDWLYGLLPPPLATDLYAEYGAKLGLEVQGNGFRSIAPLMLPIYQAERPQRFLASFAPFLSEHIEHPYCAQLVQNGMEAFVTALVVPNLPKGRHELKAIGSIAYVFRDALKQTCAQHNITLLEVKKDALPNC